MLDDSDPGNTLSDALSDLVDEGGMVGPSKDIKHDQPAALIRLKAFFSKVDHRNQPFVLLDPKSVHLLELKKRFFTDRNHGGELQPSI